MDYLHHRVGVKYRVVVKGKNFELSIWNNFVQDYVFEKSTYRYSTISSYVEHLFDEGFVQESHVS